LLGRRCSTTTRSVPEPGPLLVPDGWPVSYGFCSVGQPTKFWLLYSNHCEAVVVGMMGRLAATYFAIGSSAAVCSGTGYGLDRRRGRAVRPAHQALEGRSRAGSVHHRERLRRRGLREPRGLGS